MTAPTIEQTFALALEHHRAGRLPQAESLYRQILSSGPNAEVCTYLGLALLDQGRAGEAIAFLREAITLRADYPEAYNVLGNALRQAVQLEGAIGAYRRAIALNPGYPDPHNNLGSALEAIGRPNEAVAEYRHALALRPDFVEAAYNLGSALLNRREYDEAIQFLRLAVTHRPDLAPALNNLGEALKENGQTGEAIDCYRRALALNPDPATASNLLYALHFHPGYSAMQIKEEHNRWNNDYARPLPSSIRPQPNDRSPGGRLRVGYVSPDFRDHPAGRFVLPLLSNHDHSLFEVVCYSNVRAPDEITERIRACADRWREAAGLSDSELAEQVRRDRIDILVDLSAHLAGNRLLTFARKPAPVQVTWLGYPGSSGLDVMDYRLSDAYLDPPGLSDESYCEKTIRLPHCYWCYEPMLPDLEIEISNSRSGITFGCLNAFSKVNAFTVALWGRVLSRVPNSRLLLLAPGGQARQRALGFLKPHGVAPNRVDFIDRLPRQQYMQLYDRIDIALETFPFNGHTTTFDALWMGVPVVSLSGQTAVSRGGLSILSNLDLAELVTDDPERYVAIASALASDRSRLCEFRSTLRARMRSSPLMDGPAFARGVEAAYRRMWQTCCSS